MDNSSKETRPSPSPLQLRLVPNWEAENPQPSPRAQSLDSQTSLEEIEALDVAGEISRSISPVVNYVDYDFPEIPIVISTPETEKAAIIIQKWIKNAQRITKSLLSMKRTEFLTSMRRLFGNDAVADASPTLLDKLSLCDGTEAISLTNSSIVAKDVTNMLMGMPRDAVLRKLPVNLHGPRAFLSAALVITHPNIILGYDSSDDNDNKKDISIEGLFLKNASSMLMKNFQELAKVLLENPILIGHQRRFRHQLIMVRFARRYHAKAFGEFRKADSEKVANQLLGPYAEMIVADYHATKANNETLANAAKARMKQIRDSIIQLVGPTSGEAKLQEVEAAIKQQFIDSFGEGDMGTTSAEDTNTSASTGSGGDERTHPSIDLNELQSSLMNEQIAHELVLDSKYQLPPLPEPNPFTPPTKVSRGSSSSMEGLTPVEVEAKVASAMQDVFWENLIRSLTPVKQSCREDFKVGSIVQARYGDPKNDTFYEAKIMKINETNHTFDIKYEQDNVEEFQCPFTKFRTSKDSIDPRPLLSLLNEIIIRFEKATPNRVDLHEKYHKFIDFPFLAQMLTSGSIDHAHMLNLVRFFLDSLSNLEAPLRAQRTMTWKNEFEKYIHNLSNNSKTTTLATNASNEKLDQEEIDSISPFLLVLPSLFTFLHSALNQLQRDTVNVHLSLIANKFQGDDGIEYERQHFQDKINKHITTLQKTTIWLSASMQSYCELPPPTSSMNQNVDSYSQKRQALLSRHSPNHAKQLRALIEHSVLEMILKPIRWDSTEASSLIPETLVLDATRLASTRDSLDRIVLVSTLLVLTRQVLARRRINLTASQTSKLQDTLTELLQSPSTRLPELQEAVVTTADEACLTASMLLTSSSSSTSSSRLGEADETYLKGLISNAANPDNAIFKLFTKRITHLFKIMMSYDYHLNDKKSFEDVLDVEIGSTGLISFRNEILNVTKSLHLFVRHNCIVFAPHYSVICENVASSLPPPPNPPTA